MKKTRLYSILCVILLVAITALPFIDHVVIKNKINWNIDQK